MKRIAYIIGNNEYQNLNVLKGSKNDATLLENKLKHCGFDTNKFMDLTRENFADKVYDFKHKCMEYSVGLFYYAGHGFESNGKNYLCPIDSNLNLLDETNIVITDLVNEISKDRDFIGIIILDCCRNIYSNYTRSATTINSIIPNFKNTGGIYVAFATSSGDAAYEKNDCGLYTSLLCKYIMQPNKQIEQVFKDVRKELIEDTSGYDKFQVSWEYSSLVNEFYFAEKYQDNNLTSLAKNSISKQSTFANIDKFVKTYCISNKIKEDKKHTILLIILSEIDRILEENTNGEC